MEKMQNQPVQEPGKTYSSKSNSFTILSLCFGMIAIATCSMFFIALPAGGLSILFAILSKGRERKMQAICKAGIITSAIGMFLSVIITGAAFYMMFSNPDYRQQLNDMSQQMYGETFDDMLKERGLDL